MIVFWQIPVLAEVDQSHTTDEAAVKGTATGSITRIRIDETISRSRIYLGTFGYILKNQDQRVTGIGLTGGLQYSLSPRFTALNGLRQAYASQISLTSLYTTIDAGIIYSFSDSNRGGLHEVLLDDKPVVIHYSSYEGGWRTSLGLTQNFLNTSFSSVPFSGPTLAFYHEFSSRRAYNFDVGLQVERISNGKQSIYPTSIFFRSILGR